MDKYEIENKRLKNLHDSKHKEDYDSTFSHDPITEVSIDYEAWTEFRK